MCKWFRSYDEAYAWIMEKGFTFYPYSKNGFVHHNGHAASISKGSGASRDLFLATHS